MGLNKSKFSANRVKNCMRVFLVHLFSHVGLCVLVVSYAVAGGFLFEFIEYESEKQDMDKKIHSWEIEFNKERRDSALSLWRITERLNVLHEKNWTKEAELELDRFGKFIAERAKTSEVVIWRSDPKWTFTRALMYSVSIITTIGYGDTAPTTAAGKILTMFYAIIGVPLMLLWVSNIGNLMANTFKFAYAHGPCCSGPSNKTPKRKPKQPSPPTVQTSTFIRTSTTKGPDPEFPSTCGVSSADPGAAATQVQYSLNDQRCQTRLLEPPSRVRRKGQGNGRSLQGLSPSAKQVLLECAEYNVSHGTDERSRQILEQLQPPSNTTPPIFEPIGEEDSPERSDMDNVIELHATMLGLQVPAEEDEDAVHSFDCYPYPPCPYPFYDTTTSMAPPLPCGGGGGILRKPSVTGCSTTKKTVSLIEGCSSIHGTPSRVPLLMREETCPDLVDIDRCPMEVTSMEAERTDRVPTTLVLSIVIIYILSGAGAFSYLEDWPFYDSAYFCFITLSTIGLGDLTPGKSVDTTTQTAWTTARLVFCCLYLVLGLAIIAMSFSLVQEDLTMRTKNLARRMGIIREEDL